MSNFIKFTVFALMAVQPLSYAEDNFLLYELSTEQWIKESGPGCDRRASPCSSFKVPLSLMGFDSGILIDETSPVWPYQDDYVDWLPIWKQPYHPQMWMRNSCVWFSQVLTTMLGMPKFQTYIDSFDYGNKDLSAGLTEAWLMSSLAISPREQVLFLAKMNRYELPVSRHALFMTRHILFIEDFCNGWKLYGKTGSGSLENPDLKQGWFIGWVEKDARVVVFAYYLKDEEVIGGFGGPRAREKAKALLLEFCRES
jgi:beta-lactamase class D